MMRAWIRTGGKGGTLVCERIVPRKAPEPGQVEIAVRATSLNPVDNKLLHRPSPSGNEDPVIPHCDVAGEVARMSDGVDGFEIGDRVFGCAGGVGALSGALCDFMRADAKLIAKMPAALDFTAAAAMPLVSITAWEGLVDKARIEKGENVLILGATGGVGHLALQLAKTRGARVFAAVSSTAKAKRAEELGADEIILYNEESVSAYRKRLGVPAGFDAVFDTAGGPATAAAIEAARAYGKLVLINNPEGLDFQSAYRKALSIHFVMMLLALTTGTGRARHGGILREVATLVDQGRLKPLTTLEQFSFSEANEAHAFYESGKAVGKIVLENAPSAA